MKRQFSFALLIVFIFSCGSWALTSAAAKKKEAQNLAKLKKQELNLQKRLLIEKLQLEKAKEQTKSEGNPEPDALPRLGKINPKPPGGLLAPKVVKPAPEKSRNRLASAVDFGISLGLIANLPAVNLNYAWNHPFDLDAASIKTGIVYAQGKDSAGTERKHALIFVDGMYRLNPPASDGVGTYLGGGLNYLALTSGHVQGTVGGEVYFGLDSRMGKSEFLYVELGYGAIRTGFSPTYKGLNALIGYRTKV